MNPTDPGLAKQAPSPTDLRVLKLWRESRKNINGVEPRTCTECHKELPPFWSFSLCTDCQGEPTNTDAALDGTQMKYKTWPRCDCQPYPVTRGWWIFKWTEVTYYLYSPSCKVHGGAGKEKTS